MKEVRGQTLADVIWERQTGQSEQWTLARLVDEYGVRPGDRVALGAQLVHRADEEAVSGTLAHADAAGGSDAEQQGHEAQASRGGSGHSPPGSRPPPHGRFCCSWDSVT